MQADIKLFTVSDYQLANLQAEFAKLNKRSKRCKSLGLELKVLDTFFVDSTRVKGIQVARHNVVITGEVPVINGFTLLARIEFTTIGNIVHLAPGCPEDFDIEPYRNIKPICEACGTKRHRNNIYVLRGPEGDKIVAKNCLADYVRDTTIDGLVAWAEIEKILGPCDADPDEPGNDYYGPRAPITFQTLEFVSVIAAIVRKDGWAPRSAATGPYTADSFWQYTGTHKGCDEYREWVGPVSDADVKRAKDAIKWAAGLDGSRNAYLDTIQKIASNDTVPGTLDGYAASILSAHAKSVDDELRLRERDKQRASFVNFAGNEDSRVEGVPVRVIAVKWFDTDFGPSAWITFQTDRNERIKWRTASVDVAPGEQYILKGRIKKHESDPKWGKSTIFTRCKLEPVSE